MLQIDFINVGYGDSILLQFTDESSETEPFRVLIDCGDISIEHPTPESRRITPADYLKQRKIDTIDLLILTHLHLDHVGGLRKLAENVRIKELWTNYLPIAENWGKELDIPSFFSRQSRFLLLSLSTLMVSCKLLAEQGTSIHCVTQDQKMTIGVGHSLLSLIAAPSYAYDIQSSVFNPASNGILDDQAVRMLDGYINNTSLRLRLETHGCKIELPGDMLAVQWEKCAVSHCNLLKIPHHGQKDGMNESLLKRLSPDNVVISVSNNRPDDCPSRELIQMVQNMKTPLFFTDAVDTGSGVSEYHESLRFLVNNGAVRFVS